jgi:hypothetical protein
LQLPSNVVHVPEGKSLASMMASGEIQAGFTADVGIGREGPPKPGWETHQRPSSAAYEELWKDGHTLGIEWYRRSREELCALIKPVSRWLYPRGRLYRRGSTEAFPP